jgi:hypothetical protein
VAQDNPKTAASDGGATYRTTPSAEGGYNFTAFSLSQRDADDDGMENGFDTCPFVAAPADYDPRSATLIQPGLDDDGDGLPNNCDPTPNENSNFNDHDQDGYANRGDNCPVDANGAASAENQTDNEPDGIGNICDTNPNTADGHQHQVCLVTEIDIGAGGSPATNPQSLSPCTPGAPPSTTTTTTAGGTGGTTTTTTGGTGGTTTTGGSGVGGPASGVGSLSPVAGSIPAWAALLTAIGGLGLLASLGTLASRAISRRR